MLNHIIAPAMFRYLYLGDLIQCLHVLKDANEAAPAC